MKISSTNLEKKFKLKFTNPKILINMELLSMIQKIIMKKLNFWEIEF